MTLKKGSKVSPSLDRSLTHTGATPRGSFEALKRLSKLWDIPSILALTPSGSMGSHGTYKGSKVSPPLDKNATHTWATIRNIQEEW